MSERDFVAEAQTLREYREGAGLPVAVPVVKEQHYHRNGSGGDGFVVSLIEQDGDTMLSISFFEEDDNETLSIARTATVDIHKACEGNIRFGVNGNSKRAEFYGPIVKAAWEARGEA